MSKARTMTAGARFNTAFNNYGDKKNGGASTVGTWLPTNSALASRGVKHPYVIDPKGGLIMGGVGMLQIKATRWPRFNKLVFQ